MKRHLGIVVIICLLCILSACHADVPPETECQTNGHKFVGGVCTLCKETDINYDPNSIKHTYDASGKCTICNYQCLHSYHSELTLRCSDCRAEVNHILSDDGICLLCGYAFDGYITGSVDSLYVEECMQKGSVEVISYDTIAMAGSKKGTIITKKATVYLPYGYTDEAQYNVVYFIHGAFGTIFDYMNPDSYSDLQNVIDTMISENVIDPVIIVFPTNYDPDSTDEAGVLNENFGIQLRNDLIPAVETRYSTYLEYLDAENVTAEEIANSRDHRAIAGFSGGATQALQVAISGLDMFSYYGIWSNTYNPFLLAQGIEDDAFQDYDIKYMLWCLGGEEILEDGSGLTVCIDNYDVLRRMGLTKLTEGTNMSFLTLEDLHHDFQNVRACFYNSLKNCFFKETSVGSATDFLGAKAVTGVLSAEVTSGYGVATYEITFNADNTCSMFSDQYGFMEMTDVGTYKVDENGNIIAAFTHFYSSMKEVTHMTLSTAVMDSSGKWTMEYYVNADLICTVLGYLEPVN